MLSPPTLIIKTVSQRYTYKAVPLRWLWAGSSERNQDNWEQRAVKRAEALMGRWREGGRSLGIRAPYTEPREVLVL